jgi:molecular chaperone GrpE
MSDMDQEIKNAPGTGGSQGPPAGRGQAQADDLSAHAGAQTLGQDSPGFVPEEAPDGEAPDGEAPDGEAVAIEGELSELVKTAAQRDEYLALAQRTQADFENYRKRVARDAATAQDRGVAKLARELLPALDNLDRAIEAAEAEDPLLAGVRLVRAELAAALTRVGIQAFAPLGEPFDPNQQEAMAQQPVEGAASGTVAEVYQDGYRMGETIIRPARVLVAA